MKKHIISLYFISLVLIASSAHGINNEDEIPGFRASLVKTIPIINHGINMAFDLIKQHHGRQMRQNVLITKDNPFLALADINTRYTIRLYFLDNQFKIKYNYNNIFNTTRALQNKKIILLAKITPLRNNFQIEYQCYTDIDQGISLNQEQEQSFINTRSMLSDYISANESPILNKCIFHPLIVNANW